MRIGSLCVCVCVCCKLVVSVCRCVYELERKKEYDKREEGMGRIIYKYGWGGWVLVAFKERAG